MTEIGAELGHHIKGLRRYAMALVGEASDADDLVQETLRRALTYCSNDSLDIRDLRAYLFTILRNVRADVLARNGRADTTVELLSAERQLHSWPAQESHVLCGELLEVLQSLPEPQREVLLMVGLEGLTYQGTANLLGTPVGTVMSRLHRGREALRRSLGMHPKERSSQPKRSHPHQVQAF